MNEKLSLPGDIRNFVLDFEFKLAHACMWLGSLFNVSTYATGGKEVPQKFINALRLADMEEEYQGNKCVVDVLGKRDVFLRMKSQKIRNSLS